MLSSPLALPSGGRGLIESLRGGGGLRGPDGALLRCPPRVFARAQEAAARGNVRLYLSGSDPVRVKMHISKVNYLNPTPLFHSGMSLAVRLRCADEEGPR